MFYSYLDDSDTELGQNICLGGYYAHEKSWALFERESEPVFKKYKVEYLRGKDIVDGRNSFKGWTVEEKVTFTNKIFSILSEFVVEGVVTCVDKKWFSNEKLHRPAWKNLSPLGLAFSSTLASIVLKSPLFDVVRNDGISFLIESGHKNNGNLDRLFNILLRSKEILPSSCKLSIVDKKSCRAIQVSDMLSFFSRREMNITNPIIIPRLSLFDQSKQPIFKVMRQSIAHRFNHLWDKPEPLGKPWQDASNEDLWNSAITIVPKKL